MTRVNVGIRASRLPGKLLLAEHREITRIPNAVREGRAKSPPPEAFSLGRGHVRFFYDKLGYLAERYAELLAECRARGYDVMDKTSAFVGLPAQSCGSWHETDEARRLIEERIAEKGFELLQETT